MYYSRGFTTENPDFEFLRISDRDGCITKYVKKIASFLTSSVRLSVIQSEGIRRYISLKSSTDNKTIERLIATGGGDTTIRECLQTLQTDNGMMISYFKMDRVGHILDNIIQKWMISHPVSSRYTHRDSGYYKKLLRVNILIDHIRYIYSDKYNIYQAAYITDGYSFRATLCFVMQVVSILSLLREPGDVFSEGTRSNGDYVLMFVTVMYMFVNIPANHMTSNLSQGTFMLNVFYGMGMYSKMIFVMMDILINTVLMTALPVVSARILSGTNLSTGIVTRSLSVMLITSFDDQAISKGESNRLSDPQETFIKDMVERIDTCKDSDHLCFIRYLPWLENIALVTSLILAYVILAVN